MRNGFLVSLTALVLGTGLATAQSSKAVRQTGFLQPASSQPSVTVMEPTETLPPPRTVPGATSSSVPSGPAVARGEDEGVYHSTTFSAFAAGDADGSPDDLGPQICGPGGCFPHDTCGPDGVFWANFEMLFWWTRSVHVPPLVTTSNANDGGIIGRPSTSILYGDDNIKQDVIPGARFTLGLWIDDCNRWGLEGNYFFLGSHSKNVSFGGNGAAGDPVIARPFFNVNTNAEDAVLVTFPGLLTGNVHVRTSERLAGGEVNLLCNTCCGAGYRVDALVGLRYFEMHDGLSINQDLAVVPNANVISNARFDLFDQFDTSNRFWGGNIGLKGEARLGKFYTAFTGKVAIGGVQEVVTINGATTISAPGFLPFVAPGGILTQPSNIGHFSHRSFAVLPEAGLDLGYQICANTRIYVGYTFLYLSNAARPGDQIDRGLNPAQFPINGINPIVSGAARPAFTFHDTDFWAQGARVGLEFRY
jgi:hypothetical protein